MSKYNHSNSIPVDSIPNYEIAQAIKEWAEGDEAMEKLLWTCYDKNIKTDGCHAGAGPYIDFNYQDKIEELSKLIDTTQKIKGSQVMISVDGGNPFSGPEWYLPYISLGFDTEYKEEADICFDKLTECLEKESKKKNKHLLLKLLEFFIDKESGLVFRFKHTEEDKYEFYIEATFISDNRYKVYNDIFIKAGLIEDTSKERQNMHYWKIESNNLKEISSQIESITEYLINNYSVEPPTSKKEFLSFNHYARFMKRKMTKEKFEKWLKKQRKKMFRRRIRLFRRRPKRREKKDTDE